MALLKTNKNIITRKAYENRGLSYEDEDEAFAPLAEAVREELAEVEFEEEDEEVREKTLVKDSQLGALRIVSKNHQKENGKIKTRLQVQFVVSNAGGVILSVAEVKKDGSLSEASTFSIPALH